MPPVRIDVLELGDPDGPYGVKGVGEPPTISSTPAGRLRRSGPRADGP
jgi:CO/xanthine dehydrogenase Mo-binding subunit